MAQPTHDPRVLPPHAAKRIEVQPDGCWRWTGRLDPDGYGTWASKKAHRRIYALLVAPVAAALTLDHLCRRRDCVRPDHLDPVSLAVNVGRGDSHVWRTRTVACPQGHPYDAANTARTPTGKRYCLTCKREKVAAYRARMREGATP